MMIAVCDNLSSNAARRILARRSRPPRGVYVLPVPSYADVYPNDVTRSDARRHLRIEQARFVATFFGGIRPNKGVDRLIEAFAQLPGEDIALIVAGTPFPPAGYVERIQLLAASDPRVLLKAERVPDDEVQLYVTAADVLVFRFEHVLTSASVVLAMSFARPVIVPSLGCLPELVGEDAGFVYDPREPDGLKCALEGAMKSDLIAMGAAAARRVTAATWQDLARRTASVYRGS